MWFKISQREQMSYYKNLFWKPVVVGISLKMLQFSVLGLILVRFMATFLSMWKFSLQQMASLLLLVSLCSIVGSCYSRFFLSDMKVLDIIPNWILSKNFKKNFKSFFACKKILLRNAVIVSALILGFTCIPLFMVNGLPQKYPNVAKNTIKNYRFIQKTSYLNE